MAQFGKWKHKPVTSGISCRLNVSLTKENPAQQPLPSNEPTTARPVSHNVSVCGSIIPGEETPVSGTNVRHSNRPDVALYANMNPPSRVLLLSSFGYQYDCRYFLSLFTDGSCISAKHRKTLRVEK
ncbi:hypothetical protein CBL_11033 [Carabus blaptoides fortunei]